MEKAREMEELPHAAAAAETGEIEELIQHDAAETGEIEELIQHDAAETGEIEELPHDAAATTETEGNLVLTVDEVMDRYTGSLGLYRLLHVVLVSFAWAFDSHSTLITIFTDAQPSWRCKNHHVNASISSFWCMNGTSSGSKGQPGQVCGLAAGTWEWVGANTTSTIVERNLICHRRFLAAIPASLFFLGTNSRMCYLWPTSGRTVGCLGICISPIRKRLCSSGAGICLVLSSEAVSCKWRGRVSQYGFLFFTVGFLSLPLISYTTRTHWRYMYRIVSLPPLVYIIFLVPLVSESPRWLLVRGRNKEALGVLRKLTGGKELPDNIELIVPSSTTSTDNGGDKNEIIWTTKWAAKRMITIMAYGLGIGFVYYDIQLNAGNLNFNIYITVIINALMDIPAVLIGGVLLGFTNRRLLLSVFAISAGILSLLCIIFSAAPKDKTRVDDGSNTNSWPQLTIEAIGFKAASISFNVLYVYCVELTNVRSFAVSQLKQSFMLGASLSPLLVVVGRLSPTISFAVFGTLSILSGMLSIWLPETRNAPLYETLKQQEEEEKHDLLSPNSLPTMV
ncbi:rhodanese-like domain-containing protein 8 [Hibiscus syriacus]|uniref:Rhodanese-like domain-containing protein 8 n=1 Tax=Hibiscus syriacus TaxID=106335 RepID=A0A6A3BCF7_HIBSY|nr:rhodanese-like domain-containing protein 8 [Hibiscus syriacus]